MQCLICKAQDLEQIFIKSLHILRCKKCTLEFLWPHPTADELSRLYEGDYYDSWGKENNSEAVHSKRATARYYLSRLACYRREGVLLDVGCAFGYLLEEAKECGFDAYGVEISGVSAGVAQKKFGSKVFRGELSDANFPNKFFSVVVLSDLLEHVTDPLSFMCEVKRIMKPDGVALIVTPDTGSLSRGLMGRRNWFHYKKEHLFYFNIRSLAELTQRAGFTIIENSRARKMLSLNYLHRQFQVYKNPIFSPFISLIWHIAPSNWRLQPLVVSGGEMFVIAQPVDKRA